MLQLPKLPRRDGDEEWTFDQALDRIVEAKFDGMQADHAKADRVRRTGLRFCASARINSSAEADSSIRQRADAGADCITVHAGWGMEDDDEVDRLVDAMLEASARYDCPVYIETHRATIAQDVWRTCQLIKRKPHVRFNGDFSHYYCGQELLYPGFDVSRRHLGPILQRIAFFHGRISDGQCMQVDVGDGRSNAHVENFQALWQEAMKHWLAGARAGDILPFAPELGPASSAYSIAIRDAETGQLVELSDRWQQTLVLKRLAEESFAAANERM